MYLYRVNETLVERQSDDVEGKVTYTGLCVEEGLQDLLEVQLHDGAAHTRRDVTHLLQVLLLGELLPCGDGQQSGLKIYLTTQEENPGCACDRQTDRQTLTLPVSFLHSGVLFLQVRL